MPNDTPPPGRDGTDVRMRALLLSALMTTPDAGLEAFGAARAAGVDTWQLRRVRDILDALGKRLEGEAALDDPIMEAWSLLCPGQKDAAAPDDAAVPQAEAQLEAKPEAKADPPLAPAAGAKPASETVVTDDSKPSLADAPAVPFKVGGAPAPGAAAPPLTPSPSAGGAGSKWVAATTASAPAPTPSPPPPAAAPTPSPPPPAPAPAVTTPIVPPASPSAPAAASSSLGGAPAEVAAAAERAAARLAAADIPLNADQPGTMEARALPVGDALPYKRTPRATPPPSALGSLPAQAKEDLNQTANSGSNPLQNPMHNILPFEKAPPAPAASPSQGGPPPLPPHLAAITLDVYARVCAECACYPGWERDILLRHGIKTGDERADLDQHWNLKLGADPKLAETFARTYAHYENWAKSNTT